MFKKLVYFGQSQVFYIYKVVNNTKLDRPAGGRYVHMDKTVFLIISRDIFKNMPMAPLCEVY